MATLAEQLSSVQTAIARIEANAQATSGPERSIQFADLEKLYDREKYLKSQIAASGSGSKGFKLSKLRDGGPR